MLRDSEHLLEKINNLIQSHREDDWWDFKESYWHDKGSLVHDIICMANNRANRDAYLVMGVQDETFDITGIENDDQRRSQQEIVDILRKVKFAGGIRPRVEIQTIIIDEHEIDVLIIKNTFDVPYYLEEDYHDKNLKNGDRKHIGKNVRAFHVYTRVVDNNTEINRSADINDVEYLWKKRFGMLDTPLQHIQKLLQNPDEWVNEDGIYYHKLYPQYTLKKIFDEDDDGLWVEGKPEIYHFTQDDKSAYYGCLSLFHYTTKLYSCQSSALDEHRAVIPCPEREYIHFNNSIKAGASFRYYCKSSLEYALLRFFEEKYNEISGEASSAISRMQNVVIVFDTTDQKDDFATFVSENKELYETKKNEVDSQYITEVCSGEECDQAKIIGAYTIMLLFDAWKIEN